MRLRQSGSISQPDVDTPLVEAGDRYLMFVSPFVFSDGQPTGQYVVVGGGAGLFQASGDDSFPKQDRLSSELPAQVHRSDGR
jgi:hypothetical protein